MSLAVARADTWTVDDLFALPDDGMRHELLDGELAGPAAPTVFVYGLEDGGYVEMARLDAGSTGTAPLPYPVTLDPATLVS
jgi:hypothetical protein